MSDEEQAQKSVLGRIIVYTIFYGSAVVLSIWVFISILLQVFWPEHFPPP